MKDLREVRDMIENVKVEPTAESIDRILTILVHLTENLQTDRKVVQQCDRHRVLFGQWNPTRLIK